MAIANTLTGLYPILYRAMQTVSRENVGAVMGVSLDASAAAAAKDQTVRAAIAPASSSETIVPAMAVPETGGQTLTYVDMTLSKAKAVPIPISGEEELGLGGQADNIMQQRIEQGIRTLINEMEVDICTEAYTNASRAYGTAGTTPFASDYTAAVQLKKILDDNGAPGKNDPSYRSLVIDSTASANMASLTALSTVANAGTDATLRRGILMPLAGFGVRESAGIVSHTKGAGTGYDIVGAGEAVGQTTLSLEGGTVNTTGVKAGDIVTFAGGAASDTNKYVVNTGLTATSGDIVIGNPGLKVVKDTNDEMTIGNSYTANFGFSRNAIAFATRAPATPRMGDLSVEVMPVQDPISGITFTLRVYRGYNAIRMEVAAVWGAQAIQSEHIAVLIG